MSTLQRSLIDAEASVAEMCEATGANADQIVFFITDEGDDMIVHVRHWDIMTEDQKKTMVMCLAGVVQTLGKAIEAEEKATRN